MKRFTSLAVVFALIAAFVVPAVGMSRPTIIEYLEEEGRFEILLTALAAADLTEVLDGKKKYTINAPTDEAFGKLPEGTIPGLLADKEALTDVLLYHVFKGSRKAKKLLKNTTTPSLNGSSVFTYVEGLNAYHNQSMIQMADIRVKNGIVHEMADVMLPPKGENNDRTLVDVMRLDGRFSILLEALFQADLLETVATEKKLVLCGPTDEAFGKLPEGTVEDLLNDIPTLKNILLYHVLKTGKGKVMQLSKKSGDRETLFGTTVQFQMDARSSTVNDANIIREDVRAKNGYLQTIDAVLIPVTNN